MSNIIDFPLAVNPLPCFDPVAASLRSVVLDQVERARGSGEFAFADAEEHVHQAAYAAVQAALIEILMAAAPESELVELDGKTYRRMSDTGTIDVLGRHGTSPIERALYRQTGVRNGPTIDPIALRCGLVEGRMTPAAAVAFGRLAQSVPWREAADTAESMGALPYSRSTLQRNGELMGALWGDISDDAEQQLIEDFEVPEEAVSVSVSADRVSLPFAEERELTAKDRKRGVTRPLSVVFHMAYCGVWTLHDAEGKPLHSVRYGYAPELGADQLETALREDIAELLRKRSELRVVTLADGAPEMQNLLDRVTADIDVEVRMIDFWHLIEKLGGAVRATNRRTKRILKRFARALLSDDAAIEDIERELLGWAERYQDEPPKKLHEALTYIENHRERFRYASARAAGLPIGSGHVEATCKTVVSVRMKRCGARWKPDGAQSVLSLRALATSSRWKPAMKLLIHSYTATVTEVAA